MQQRKDRNNNIRNGPRVHAMTLHSDNTRRQQSSGPLKDIGIGEICQHPHEKGFFLPHLSTNAIAIPARFPQQILVGKSVTTPYTPIASPWGIVYPPRNEVYNRFVRVVHPNQFSKLFSFPFVPAFRSTTVCTLILKSTLKIATSLSAHQDSKSITTIDKCISLAT